MERTFRLCQVSLLLQKLQNLGHHFLRFHWCHGAAAEFQFHFSFSQGFLADPDPNGKSYQVSVFELHSRAIISIIEDYFHSEASKFALLILNTFFAIAVGLACVFAVLKLSFGA